VNHPGAPGLYFLEVSNGPRLHQPETHQADRSAARGLHTRWATRGSCFSHAWFPALTAVELRASTSSMIFTISALPFRRLVRSADYDELFMPKGLSFYKWKKPPVNRRLQHRSRATR